MLKYPRILFFIESSMPTKADIKAIAQLGGNAVFRNAAHCGEGHNPEVCDGVSGAVPAVYKEKYKDGAEVLAAFVAANAVIDDTPVETPTAPPAPVDPVPSIPAAPVPTEVPPAPAPAEETLPPEIPPAPVDVDGGWGQQPQTQE